MKMFAMIGSLVLLCAVSALGDEPQAGGQAAATPLTADRVRDNPDDVNSLNLYIGQQLGSLRGLMDSDPEAADKRLDDLAGLLEGLKPESEAAKTLVQRGKSAVAAYRNMIELARLTMDDIRKKLEANPDDVQSVMNFINKVARQIAPLTRTQPEEAEQQLTAAREFLAGISDKAEQDATKRAIQNSSRTFDSLTRSIESGRKLVAMIGKDAAPLEVEAWANGEALGEGDLKGKVVLLDFWAVGCGPCIATFPHLREWQEKYADKGLVIVGLTRFYNYAWNDATGRAQRSQDPVEKEDELKMLEKFAESHNLHHRFAIQKDSALSSYYGVTGIPHVVVIDQEQKIRLMRVGSGEPNARDVEDMIKQLLGE